MEKLDIWAVIFKIEDFVSTLTFEHVEKAIKYAIIISFAYVAVMVLRRLPMIRETMKYFIDARSPIWDLRNTVEDVKKLEPVISKLGGQVDLFSEKLNAIQKQFTELQIQAVSERTGAANGGETDISRSFAERLAPYGGRQLSIPDDLSPLAPSAPADDERDENWDKLRELWYRNTERLEGKIDAIEDGRRKLKYDRMLRYQYNPIIRQLEADGIIGPSAAFASVTLNDTFMRYRPRRKKVPDDVIGPLLVLDRQLDAELGPVESTTEAH